MRQRSVSSAPLVPALGKAGRFPIRDFGGVVEVISFPAIGHLVLNTPLPVVASGENTYIATHSCFIIPPEVANTAPVFNRGSGGGARGCGFEERVGAHARLGGSISYSRFCLSVFLSVTKWRLIIQKKGPAFTAASRGMNSAASS